MDLTEESDSISCTSTLNSCMDEEDYNSLCHKMGGTEYLSNVDYSLNSPLIFDELNEFLKFMRGDPYRKSWNLTLWKRRRDAIKRLNNNPRTILNPKRIHHWLGEKNLSSKYDSQRFSDLLKVSQDDSEETFPILQSFIKGWLGKDIDNIDKSQCPQGIKKWGAYFLDFHIITFILNSVDFNERRELTKIKGVKFLTQIDQLSMVYDSDNFGKILITNGVVYVVNDKILLDRNAVLMCKDVFVARFQTLFAMINRCDSVFRENDWTKISLMYANGDKLLVRHGNNAYDSIKLVEPVCALKLSEMAREFRNLIPQFPAYQEHINQSLFEGERSLPGTVYLAESIDKLDSPDLVLTAFGSFRHWGHPNIQYLEGLKAVNKQVTAEKEIDKEYAEALGSDLAFIVLSQKFKETKQWYVDKDKMDKDSPLYQHVKDDTWPTPKQIQDFGDNWHKLPLTKCFEVPDMIDPSLIYADKSHSMNRSEVLNHIKRNPSNPVPSKKVLETFLSTEATNWKEFLKDINDNGLTWEDLVIGLKGKEREIKIKGRFFTLMSWRLREYFVVTEHLIKIHFVPLFKGLTMADDLNTVIKKMMDNTSGQGNDDYERICIANHIDYEKWNNHQRHEANMYVFEVMGKFLGYPQLISRTHEFFQKSLIYYNGRPDLMRVTDNLVENKTEHIVSWEGQDGGLEGLRQKGWSVVNLLVIRRESQNRNTKVSVLAQGDNQVICTQFKVQKSRTQGELIQSINSIIMENNRIMEAIERGTNKLGLIINKDETLQSADLLIYGKVPIFRGNIKGLETKRWSRVTCVTNDQLPTLSNTLSTINSNALTVSHFSDSPLNAMMHYNFIGNFGRRVLEIHNPALKSQTKNKVKNPHLLESREYKSAVLYLDPCLGGACGMSLTRFLIRNFPDPLTESLAFWKLVHSHGEGWVKNLAERIGNPRIGNNDLASFKKLLEDPLSINIPGGVNPNTLIKEEIKRNLIGNMNKLKNEVVKSALAHLESHEEQLIDYLRSIKPLFPRFISEYLSSTYIGITRSLLGLFQNSKTIRSVFSKNMDNTVKKIIIKSELQTIQNLMSFGSPTPVSGIWRCSSTKADNLRLSSWGTKVCGATVPHPIELLNLTVKQGKPCGACNEAPPKSYYISTMVPEGLKDYKTKRGPYKAYLGSKTSESTSILQPWEKESKIPIIKRATKLRNAIGWFVEENSKLGHGLLQNIESLTGEKWDLQNVGAKRTGSALHRFSCSRQSSAGYAARSPSKLTWICSTTDTLSTLNTINHDFMHQSLLLFAQTTVCELMDNSENSEYYHSHISCEECLREIEEIQLDTDRDYVHPDVSDILQKWKPEEVGWAESRPTRNIKVGNWEGLDPCNQSFHVGRAEGFLYGDLVLSGSRHSEDSSLFPLSIQKKISPEDYLKGLIDGLARAASIHCTSRRSIADLKKPREALLGMPLHLIDQVSQNNSATTGLLEISGKAVKTLYSGRLDKRTKSSIRSIKDLIIRLKDPNANKSFRIKSGVTVLRVDQEIRHACKYIFSSKIQKTDQVLSWGRELEPETYGMEVQYCSEEQILTEDITIRVEVPRIQNPLISSLRTFQFATGSHYKIQGIINDFDIKYRDVLSGGDGSGGIGPFLARNNKNSKLIFNSLLLLREVDLKGTTPSPPSAIQALGTDAQRCVNLNTAWENPSDLSLQETWDYFKNIKERNRMFIDLVTLDMECTNDSTSDDIEKRLAENIFDILESNGTLIYKTYLHRLIRSDYSILLNDVGSQFARVYITYSQMSSSQTSEVYLVMRYRERHNLTLVPNKQMILSAVKEFPVFRTPKEEFERALEVSKLDMFKGVPRQLRSDPSDDIITLGISLGVETGVMAVLSETTKRVGGNGVPGFPYITFFVMLNSLLKLTGIHKEPPRSKTDSQVYNIGCLVCGFLNWISIAEEIIIPHENAQKFIEDKFLFSWITKKAFASKKKGKTEVSGVRKLLGYSNFYSFTGNYSKSKNFYLDSYMARIGQVTRIFFRLFGKYNDQLNSKKINETLKEFDRGLTVGVILSKTDIGKLLFKKLEKSVHKTDVPCDYIDKSEFQESAYVS